MSISLDPITCDLKPEMYDLTIIGGGWAGVSAARHACSLGLKVALVEKSLIGGTCLNQGCIPTKALLYSAKVFSLLQKSNHFGIETASEPRINFSEIQGRKEKIVGQLRRGIEFSLKGVECINKEAVINSSDTVLAGSQEIKTRNILIATGSVPVELAGLPFDNKKILSSSQLLQAHAAPASLLIIGAGVIGCEFATLFSRLGSRVTLVELQSQLLPGEDKAVARKLATIFAKRSIKVMVNTDVSSLNLNEYETVVVCVGRKPYLPQCGLEKIGITLHKGAFVVNDYLQTNLPNIYAAGDCTGICMLAHYAAYQARRAVEHMVSPEKVKKEDTAYIPHCIFTDPEIASVGLNEEQCVEKGIELQVHTFDFLGSGMARIVDETEGFVRILSDKNTGRVAGASMIGPRVTELISIITAALHAGMKVEGLKEIIFPHPTFSESIHEAL